jgi:DNA polymerase-3 subunit beta
MVLDGKKVHECVKAIPIGEVTIEYDLETRRAVLKGGTVSFTLHGEDPDTFPSLPDVQGEQFDLTAAALLEVVGNVAYCQSSDVTKYRLNGIYCRIEPNQDDELFVTTCATDGYRLAIATTPLPGEPRPVPKDLAKGVIIPGKGVAQLLKIGTDGIVVLSIAGNNLKINTPEEVLYLRLVDGTFPDFGRVIPRNPTGRCEVKRQMLSDALQRCRILSDKDGRRVKLGFDTGSIAIVSVNQLLGQAADRVTAGVQCEPFELALNADYLIQTLDNLSADFVEISLGGADAPLLVNPLGTDTTLAVIMPQRS